MLIMNQNRDALIDTTGAVIRIDTVREEEHVYYCVCGYSHDMIVTISEHEDLEEAKKALAIIRYAVVSGATTCNFDDDVVNNLDTVIEGFESLMRKQR